MQLVHPDRSLIKGWYNGPWDSTLSISVGYVTGLIQDPHLHDIATEIYLVASGSAKVRVEQETVTLHPGDALTCAPGEAHAFLETSPDYFHFVILSPGLEGEAAERDKIRVPRSRLGLE